MAIPQHIDALTVGSSAFIQGDTIQLTADEQHRRQFALRKMWAMTMVAEMKRRRISWDKIRELTGKSRPAWNNVCGSGYVPRVVDGLSDEERKEIHDGNNYRPVSNKFIGDVTASVESHGYSIHSLAFRNAFDLGMRVVVTAKALFEFQDVQRGLLLHLDDDASVLDFIDGNLKPTKDVVTIVNGIKDGWDTMGRPFPLLCTENVEVGGYNALFYVCDVECLVFGVDEETGRPNDKAVNALEEWEVQQWSKEDLNPDEGITPIEEFQDVPTGDQNIPIDGGRFTPPKQVLLKDAIAQADALVPQGILKADDGKPLTADMGGFFVQLPRTEVLPQMINNQRQAAFHVIVQFNDKNEPIGTVVMHNPKGGFSVNGL